jgi:hypothetical protein
MRYQLDPFSAVGIAPETEAPKVARTVRQTSNGYIGNAVKSVQAGTNVTVDNTDPLNPIVSSTASGGSGSGITRTISSISSPTTAAATSGVDYVYLVSGTTTLTLPTAVGNTNRYTVKNVGANTVTIATTSAQTIDGSASATLPVRYTSVDLISDGSNWNVV